MSTDDLLQEFIDEAQAQIEQMESAFVDFEGLKNEDRINGVFRVAHSIKGTAGFFQLKKIVELAHAMENLLGKIRSKGIDLTEDVVDVLLLSNDRLKDMISNVAESDTCDISSSLNAIERLLSGVPHSVKKDEINQISGDDKEVSAHLSDLQFNPSPQINEKFYEYLKKLTKSGHKIFKISLRYDQNSRDKFGKIQELASSISEIGKIVDVSIVDSDVHEIKEIEGIIRAAIAPVIVEVIAASVLAFDLFAEAVPVPKDNVIEIHKSSLSKNIVEEKEPHDEFAHHKTSENVRVNLKILENLMAFSGELVLARNQLLTAFNEKADESSIAEIIKNVDSLTSKIQDEVMLTRMQPIRVLFSRFPRFIRELARGLKKEITLKIDGGNLELDKTMMEALGDPLTHIVRNCADHGIEPPDKREASGKLRNGTISLKAYQSGGFIVVEVSDDGWGLDPEIIRRNAVDKRFVTYEQLNKMSDAQVFNLIFLPGFSTAKSISNISGRGVGMDIVRENVDKLGGTIEVSSQKGIGTKIALILPRTLAIVNSLIVGVGSQRFAIPQANIAMVIEPQNIEHIHYAREARIGEAILPLISLPEILKVDQTDEPKKIVVINVMKNKIGLLVNEIFDTHETLVKPLPSFLKSCLVYSGVTIMGDGRISLILDVEGIAKTSDIRIVDKSTANEKVSTVEHQNLMIFKCSGPEYFAVDMNMVARVETIKACGIQQIGDDKYVNINGKPIKIIYPEAFLPVKNSAYSADKLMVIIPKLVSRPIGLIASEIVDNISGDFILDRDSIKISGIFGTIIHQSAIVIVLDLYEMFEAADPLNYPKYSPAQKAKILIVDDSPFFRDIETKYICSAGFETAVAVNGENALKVLNGSSFDLVLCDIDMPGMDGFEFIRNIRSDPNFQDIPVVALASARYDCRQRAFRSGFDAFENKIDKERLLKAVRKLLRADEGVNGK